MDNFEVEVENTGFEMENDEKVVDKKQKRTDNYISPLNVSFLNLFQNSNFL